MFLFDPETTGPVNSASENEEKKSTSKLPKLSKKNEPLDLSVTNGSKSPHGFKQPHLDPAPSSRLEAEFQTPIPGLDDSLLSLATRAESAAQLALQAKSISHST